ncbi:5'-methylthioadenosine/adenosylhomocysteine nucleosidase [bacterium]|nr:5'-methylthioadenosine/adenosylhomocysteine nucleosidase [bacterium]
MLNNGLVAIIGAMDCEVELLKNILTEQETIEAGRFSILKGKIGNHEVVVAKSGVGKVCASSCTQFLIDKFSPVCIVNTGIAGGIASDLSIGDVVIATELVQHDFDATALGYARGYMCNGINPDRPTVFYADKTLIEIFEKSASQTIEKSRLHKGIIASGDMFVGSAEKKQEIKKIFNASAAEMEGAAIAQTAFLNNVPFIIIRAVSDLADGTATDSLADFEYKSAQISSAIIKDLLNNN